jgi:H+/Cl- antiporter ClcA
MFMGSVIGRAAAVVVPGIAPAAGMLAGMAAFNAAVTGTPLLSALIAIALTNGAGVTPAFLASLTAFLASPSIGFLEETAPRSESPGLHIAEDD